MISFKAENLDLNDKLEDYFEIEFWNWEWDYSK